jgi:hypothetical protein
MADTPQIAVPIASSEPSLPDSPNARATMRMMDPAIAVQQNLDQAGAAQLGDIAEHESCSERHDPDF